jgi:flavin-dependent dehydrogenase
VPVKKRVGNGSVYVVGDAAAQVKVSTVGGIVTGFRGARAVAASILNGAFNHELFALRRELSTHWLLRRTMHHFEQKHYSNLVDLLNAATRNALSEITRDESARLLWTVLRRQPQLVLLGLRGLIQGWSKK